jgi:hypothetical protein
MRWAFKFLLDLISQSQRLFSKVESHLAKLLSTRNAPTMQTTTDEFNLRSILLWLAVGCLGVFASLQILKCLLKKSERQSEQYRLSRRVEFSMNDDLKSTVE